MNFDLLAKVKCALSHWENIHDIPFKRVKALLISMKIDDTFQFPFIR